MEIWKTVQRQRKTGGKESSSMKMSSSKRSLTDDEERNDMRKKHMTEEFKVIMKFKTGQEISSVSPITLTNCLRKALGDIEVAKVLRDGSLFLKCKNAGQRDKALKLQRICEKEVAERHDSMSVMLEFKDQFLPDKVMIGYMSFNVRAYVQPSIRCYKCQRYGHVATVCRGKQRCGRCGGEHLYGKCGNNNSVKCCNCGGNHTAAYGGCTVRKQAVEIQQVRAEQRVTYAEAIKIVSKEKRVEEMEEAKQSSVLNQQTGLSTEKLVLFLAYVINCSDQAKTKTEKIKIIVKAAAKFLNMKELSWEKIQADLSQGEGTSASSSPYIS
ncbi:uncharacterized protein LOC125878859 [Epinephelus fuscoguttatus]|uniref:uncharacterized protein LOC125878859 n=1 Tax=Epinephelus fuscoguttatus TaxID=293821 RepID=UPI0020D05D29|nr:uncharacterized protein LOC125878859 [Epinephelus fuscoguttatus]